MAIFESHRNVSRTWSTWVGTAAVLLLVTTACGSTVGGASSGLGAQEATGVGEQGLSGGTTVEGELEPGDVDVDRDGIADAGSGVGDGTVGNSVSDGGPGTDGPGPAPGGRIPVGPGVRGVTDTTIKLGFQVDDFATADSVSSSMGGGENFGDSQVQQKLQAVVDYINANGGIAGRKVAPVWHFEDATSVATATGRQQEAQRSCATWTEDNPVFAFGGGDADPSLRECAVRTKTPMVVLDHTVYPSQKMFESFAPYWYAPHLMVADRRERALAKTLLADGFFTRGAKVGILVEDSPGVRAGVDAGMKPVLEAAGIEVVEVVYPDPIDSPWSTYVLRFQSEKVTHVIMSTSAYLWAPALFMMNAAESQAFRPRWGMGSDQAPNLIGAQGAPPKQLANAQGMGWIPLLDEGPAKFASAQEQLCVEIMTKAGYAAAPGDGGFCEFAFFMKTALDRAKVISPAGLAEAVGRLGSSYKSTMTLDAATAFAPGRHDGPSVMRSFGYDERCEEDNASCFRYTSPVRPIPS